MRALHRPPLLTTWNLTSRQGFVHAFTTRNGGVSVGGCATLNLALRAGDTETAVVENWRRVITTMHPDLRVSALALLDQVHGTTVLEVKAAKGPLLPVGQADAAFTTEIGIALAVRTADCVPVLVVGPGIVGVAHAGWRGTAGGVVDALISAMLFRTKLAAHQLAAAIGPRISGNKYEVGHEVVAGLVATGLDRSEFLVHGRTAKPHVDLGMAVLAQLRRSGVIDVELSEKCTASEHTMFSHRRDGPNCGRIAGVVARMA